MLEVTVENTVVLDVSMMVVETVDTKVVWRFCFSRPELRVGVTSGASKGSPACVGCEDSLRLESDVSIGHVPGMVFAGRAVSMPRARWTSPGIPVTYGL
jgi:hypothetical protein